MSKFTLFGHHLGLLKNEKFYIYNEEDETLTDYTYTFTDEGLFDEYLNPALEEFWGLASGNLRPIKTNKIKMTEEEKNTLLPALYRCFGIVYIYRKYDFICIKMKHGELEIPIKPSTFTQIEQYDLYTEQSFTWEEN